MKTIQAGVVGAMQRSHPALSQLWLKSLGIPGIEFCKFNSMRDDVGHIPMTVIELAPIEGKLGQMRQDLCDVLGYPEDHDNRRSSRVMVTHDEEAHQHFWRYARDRELDDVDGPLEFWWELLVIRCRGIKAASRALLGVIAPDLARGRVSFDSCLKTGTSAKSIVPKEGYSHPEQVRVTFPELKNTQYNTVELDLQDLKFKATLVRTLIELAISVA